MTNRRLKIPLQIKQQVLHEAGYKCGNPTCRSILTLDIHHLDYVSEGGDNSPSNLLALCPNCHSLHHKGHIPLESLRTWKILLLSLNEAFDKRSINILLALDKVDSIIVSGDGLLDCASLIASGIVKVEWRGGSEYSLFGEGLFFSDTDKKNPIKDTIKDGQYWIELSEKGHLLVSAWKQGDQKSAVNAIPIGKNKTKNES